MRAIPAEPTFSDRLGWHVEIEDYLTVYLEGAIGDAFAPTARPTTAHAALDSRGCRIVSILCVID